MSQPTIESVIEKEIESFGNIGRDDSNIRIALEKIADLARSEERTRCVEIVRSFHITDWSRNQLEKLADSINTKIISR